jgi:hypothetical protein
MIFLTWHNSMQSALLYHGAACLVQACIDFVQFVFVLDLNAKVVETGLSASR